MSEFRYVIRENGIPELITVGYNEAFLDLDDILEDNYQYIADSMLNEDYFVEVGISTFFEEILYDNKVVGFVIFDVLDDFQLKVIDCYILPEFRGNGLFFETIERLLFLGSKLTFLEPTRNVVELLLNYGFARKINDDIVVSAIEFNFDDFDLKSEYENDSFISTNSTSSFYDLSICSTILLENGKVLYHELLKNDLNTYGERKNLSKNYFDNIRELFTKNHDELYQIASDIKNELPQLGVGYDEIIGHDDELSVYMNEMVRDGFFTYDEGLEIKNKLKNEYESGEIKNESDLNRRLFYYSNKFSSILNFIDEGDDIDENLVGRFVNQLVSIIGSDSKLNEILFDFLNNDDEFMNELPDNVLDELLDYEDDDIFSHVDFYIDFTDSQDRELYFDYVLENRDGKYSLSKTDLDMDVQNDLDMFIVLKLFKRDGDFISAIVDAGFNELNHEDFIEELLLKEGYIDDSVDYDNWDDFSDKYLTVSDIKDLLRKNNLKVSGKKQELVDRVRENNLSLDEFSTSDYRLTDSGIQYLKENWWMEFYNIFLVPYEFADFYKYYKNHDGDVVDIAYDYMDEFVELADKNNDNKLLTDSVTTNKLIYRYSDKLFKDLNIFE